MESLNTALVTTGKHATEQTPSCREQKWQHGPKEVQNDGLFFCYCTQIKSVEKDGSYMALIHSYVVSQI